MKPSEKLVRIDPPSRKRSPKEVGRELAALIRNEYSLNTAAICKLLLCERQWVDANLRGEVKHLFITYYFRRYMLEEKDILLDEQDADTLRHGFYFYSKESLAEYWRSHAAAARKTALVDLALYQKNGFSAELSNELEYHQSRGRGRKETTRHLDRMETLLTERGMELYRASLAPKGEWMPCNTPSWPLAHPLTNTVTYCRATGVSTNSAAIVRLVRLGAIRIKLGARALWYIPDASGYLLPIAVPCSLLESKKTDG